MEEGEEPPISKLFTIKCLMNKYKKKDAPPSDCNGDRVTVSEFDCCVDNYFRAIETISKLCGEDDEDCYALQQTEIQRLSSSLTFLRLLYGSFLQVAHLKIRRHLQSRYGPITALSWSPLERRVKDAPVEEEDCNGDRVTVLDFDCCVDNYFKAIETISKLCGEPEEDDDYALQ